MAVVTKRRADLELSQRCWPRSWSEQQPLLDLQHDRLAVFIQELLQVHDVKAHGWSLEEALAVEAACRRLLWDLKLHLRLEGRWLSQSHCFHPSHRVVHGEALKRFTDGLRNSAGDRLGRQGDPWLVRGAAEATEHTRLEEGPMMRDHTTRFATLVAACALSAHCAGAL